MTLGQRPLSRTIWVSQHQRDASTRLLQLILYTFNGLFSRTTWASRYQTGKASLDLNEARYDGVSGWQLHQLDHKQKNASRSRQMTISTPHHSISTGRMLFLTPNQQCLSTDGTVVELNCLTKIHFRLIEAKHDGVAVASAGLWKSFTSRSRLTNTRWNQLFVTHFYRSDFLPEVEPTVSMCCSQTYM